MTYTNYCLEQYFKIAVQKYYNYDPCFLASFNGNENNSAFKYEDTMYYCLVIEPHCFVETKAG